MTTTSLTLKINALSHIAEARIIRKYETRVRKHLQAACRNYLDQTIIADHQRSLQKLKDNRHGPLAVGSREIHLARMFVKGTPYSAVERYVIPGNEPNWDRIKQKLVRHEYHNGYAANHSRRWEAFDLWAGINQEAKAEAT